MPKLSFAEKIKEILQISLGISVLALISSAVCFLIYIAFSFITGSSFSFVGFLESNFFALIPVGMVLLLWWIITSQGCF